MSAERSQQPQMSDWSMPTMNESPAKEKRIRKIPALLGGLLLGALLAGVVLAVVISLWLTTPNRTTVGSTASFASNATNSLSSTTITMASTSSLTTVVTSIITTTGSTSRSATSTTVSTTITSSTASTSPVVTYVRLTPTTSAVARTVTSTSCNTPTSTLLYYSPGPRTYTSVSYNYTAVSSGTGYVEFGFLNPSSNRAWFLDDVSLQDVTASNVQMLINGDFENGDLKGWEVACTTNCQSFIGGDISSQGCHKSSSCYLGACATYYDFLRQTFPKTAGHLYNLSFWLMSDAFPGQQAFVNIG